MLLRLDPQVHAALARWAADDMRSINAQVEWLLRRALTDAGRLPHETIAARRTAADGPEDSQTRNSSGEPADDRQPSPAEGDGR
jgi:hypothetical protein